MTTTAETAPLNEARHLLRITGSLKPAIDVLMTQFNVCKRAPSTCFPWPP